MVMPQNRKRLAIYTETNRALCEAGGNRSANFTGDYTRFNMLGMTWKDFTRMLLFLIGCNLMAEIHKFLVSESLPRYLYKAQVVLIACVWLAAIKNTRHHHNSQIIRPVQKQGTNCVPFRCALCQLSPVRHASAMRVLGRSAGWLQDNREMCQPDYIT